MSTPATTPSINAAVRNRNQLARFPNLTVSGCILTGDTGTLSLAAAKAGHQYFVRRVAVNVSATTSATASFRAKTTTAQIFFSLAGSLTVALDDLQPDVDYGEVGWAAPIGEGLEISLSAAGNAFAFVVEMYLAPQPQSSGVLTPAQAIP